MSVAIKDSNKELSKEVEKKVDDKDFIFSNINYICGSTSLIVESLRKGLDVAQLPSGDIIITEVKTVHTHYTWDTIKNKMVKLTQY